MSHPKLRHLSNGHLGIMAAINHDLVENPVNLATAQIGGLRDHGGPKIAHPRLWLIFVNDWWGDWKQAEAYARDLMTCGYLEPLKELGYGYQGGASYGGSIQVQAKLPTVLKDSDIRTLLQGWALAGKIPTPGPDELFATVWPNSVRVVFDGDRSGSCETWCGYHSNMVAPRGGQLYYTVQTSTECSPCNGGIPAFSAFMEVLSHEVAEAVTDPEGTGWYRDSDGSENADQVAWVEFQWGPWKGPQGYATNERGNTIGAYTPVSVPQPPPPPPADDLAARILAAVKAEAAKLEQDHEASPHATSLKWKAQGAAAVEAAAEAVK